MKSNPLKRILLIIEDSHWRWRCRSVSVKREMVRWESNAKGATKGDSGISTGCHADGLGGFCRYQYPKFRGNF